MELSFHVIKASHPSQKCHISHTNFLNLNCCLGSVVQITTTSGEQYLCKIFTDQTLDNNVSLLEKTVRIKQKQISTLRGPSLNVLELKPAKTVSLLVVIENLSDIVHLKKVAKLDKLVKDLLTPFAVIEGCSVDLSKFLPAKLLKISSIEIVETFLDHTAVHITSQTIIIIKNIVTKSWLNFHDNNTEVKLGGLDKIYNNLEETILFPLQNSLCSLKFVSHRSLLLCGPSGCGKTSLVRKLAQKNELLLLEVSSADLSSSSPGESEKNLREIFEQAADWSKESPTIIFLDNVDSYAAKRGNGHAHTARFIVQLAVLLDNLMKDPESKLIVIGATDKPDLLDPVLRRPGRFDKEIVINVPNQGDREDILRVICGDLNLELEERDIELIAQITPGYTGADLALLCREVSYAAEGQPVGFEIFKRATGKIRPSVLKHGTGVVEVTKVTWDQIGGLDEAILYIRRSVEWPLKHPEAFARLNVPRPKGVLIYGPPGCGKSLLVRAAATSCAASFLSISAAELFSPFVGDSEKMVTDVFNRARQAAPCILFLDELDAMVGGRSSAKQGHGAQLGVIAALLQEMDGISSSPATTMSMEEQIRSQGVIVVAATNRPDKIDAALMRPGRFDSLVYIPPPDYSTRLSILQKITRKMPVNNVELESVAQKTELFSGADLDILCKEAALAAMEQDITTSSLTNEHFEIAMKKVPRSLTTSQVEWYKTYSSKRK